MKLQPLIFSHGTLHAVYGLPSETEDVVPWRPNRLTWTVLPPLLFNEMLHLRSTVARMLWPIRNDLLLTLLTPNEIAVRHGAA